MINPVSSATASPVAYSGGTAPTSRPGFGAALAAKLAELQTVTSSLSAPGRHHPGDPQQKAAVDQDAGSQNPVGMLGGREAGTVSG
jgi:hypothetical protein